MEEKITHKFSTVVTCCGVAHLDKDGNILPQCIKCEHCKEFIRPECKNDPCIIPDRTPVEYD